MKETGHPLLPGIKRNKAILETRKFTLRTSGKIEDNIISVIKDKGLSPCGQRNLTWKKKKKNLGFKPFYLLSQCSCIFLGKTRR